MDEQLILVDVSTYIDYGDDDEFNDAGGSVEIICNCGFKGVVDADSDGNFLFGDCGDYLECTNQFEVRF